jgi:hypothetical protein
MPFGMLSDGRKATATMERSKRERRKEEIKLKKTPWPESVSELY